MRGSRLWLLPMVAVCLAVALASASFAATVVVKPSNMNGWVADAFQGLDENSTTPTVAFSNCSAPPYLDALYVSMGYSVEPPNGTREEATNEVWCGTNQFNSVKITDITKLQYSTFTEFSGNLWESHTSNPIKMVLTIKTDGVPDNYPSTERTADGPKNWLVLIYSPWDPGNGPGLRTWDRTNYGCWQTWDTMQGVWYVGMEPLDNNWQSWSEIVTNYPNATLEYPYTYDENLAANNAYGGIAAGIHDPWKAPYSAESRYSAATLTGTSLSLQAGARRTFDSDFGGAWWKEHIGMKGFADMVSVGVSGNETTFDFQGDTAPAPFVAVNNQAAASTLMRTDQKNFHAVVFGKVLDTPAPDGLEFVIDDGSAVSLGGAVRNIKVKAVGFTAIPGSYVRAAGMMRAGMEEADDITVSPAIPKPQPTLFSDADSVSVMVPAP